jgi:hypothetical protein
MSPQSNKKIMMKLQIMRIIVGKYPVLFRSARQYLPEIEEIMNQPRANHGIPTKRLMSFQKSTKSWGNMTFMGIW